MSQQGASIGDKESSVTEMSSAQAQAYLRKAAVDWWCQVGCRTHTVQINHTRDEYGPDINAFFDLNRTRFPADLCVFLWVFVALGGIT